MDTVWERTFEFAYALADVWNGYLVMQGATTPPPVGMTFVLNDAASTHVEITDVVDEERIGWSEKRSSMTLASTIVFESTSTGTRITITRAGFGTDDDFDVFAESNELGYAEAMQDLATYLVTGVLERRHLQDRCATGVVFKETLAGLVVRRVSPDSLGTAAGLREGDLLIGINGAAIYMRTDLWLLQRTLQPGSEVEVRYVRDGDVLTGRGVMLPCDRAVTGELGLGPRED